MIRSFADRETERLFSTGAAKRFPPDIVRRAIGRLQQLHLANRVEELRNPPSNRLEALKGDRAGQWSIRVNEQWRCVFVLKAVTLSMSRSSITTEELHT